MARDWTPTEVDLLQNLWQKGYTMPDIAVIMGRTLVSIQHKKQRIGLQGNNKKKSDNSDYQYAKYHNTSQKKMRKCISRVVDSCEGEFMSEHVGHRICKRCRDSIAKAGISYKFMEPHDVRKT